MILQWVTDPKKAAEMAQRIMEITTKGFGPKGCTITLEDGQMILNAKLVASNSGNNAGQGGQWAYYGSVTVITEDDISHLIDASTIKRVS